MPVEFDNIYGYNDGEDLVLSNENLGTILDPVANLVQNITELPDLNSEWLDHEDIEDEEELQNVGVGQDLDGEDEEFAEAEDLFAEERSILNEQVLIEPVYNSFPEGYNADHDSFPYSGLALPDNFDAERDELTLGMLFRDKKSLQEAVKEWSIRNNRQFTVRKGATNKTSWEVYCYLRNETGCNWRLRGSFQKRSNLWEIVTLNPTHSCLFTTTHRDHPNLTSCLITKEVSHLIAIDPSIKISMLVAEIEKKYKIKIAYQKAWYAKQLAVAQIFGDWRESYAKLPRLLLALKQKNPGSVMSTNKSLQCPITGECQLIRLFWAFGPSLQGFQHCRPVMSIDATHLYGKYKGKLLVALGVDGNGQIYPVAFGVVKEETKADWGWFLKKLRAAIGPRPNLCLISDRHVGIIAAVSDPNNGWAPPMATHRFCLRHVRSNWNTHFHNATLKNLVYRIGSEIEKRHFETGMQELKNLHVEGWKWCQDIPKEQWALAYDDGQRYGCCTTNLVECFNGVLLSGRNLPICAMVMLVYHRLVQYFVEKRNNYNRLINVSPHGITDRGVALLNQSRENARNLHVSQIYCRSRGIASVVSSLNNSHPVNLSTRTCGCGSWDQYKIPCGHAIRVCMALNIDHTVFVHQMYKLEAYRLAYTPQFYPLDHQAYWPPYTGPTIVPLHGTLRGIGRPQSTRFRNEMDESISSQQNLCSRCRQPGHTIRTCRNPTLASSSAPPPAQT